MTRTTRDMTFGALPPFLALTFGFTWGIAALYILFTKEVEALFGALSYTNPLFILAVYSPGFAGALLVARHDGVAGLGRYVRRLTMWRMAPVWWAFLVLGIPLLFAVGAAIRGTLHLWSPRSTLYDAVPALLVALFIGPIEEFGWRGVALPLLQRRLVPLWAGLVLGAVWGIWHLPAFLLSGTPQSAWSFGPFLISVIAISVILTAMFNAARGSLLVAVLFHFQMNNPLWPDAQPWDALVFGVMATVIAVIDRGAMFNRAHAATGVLVPGIDPSTTHEVGSDGR